MVVPANPRLSHMELDPGGESVSFLVRLVPHPRMRCYSLKLLLLTVISFPSGICFCHGGHDREWPVNGERFVAKNP